jgi:AGCS family alanine or glycine:cation symporter
LNFSELLRYSLCALIFGGGTFFLFYLKAFFFIHPIKTVREMFWRKDKTGISPFRALSASLSGTLGVGNIVGVAVAMITGGAGAVFWIWVSAFVSMILKYCEITLGVKYRKKRAAGLSGGPMYYMEKGIGGRFGRVCGSLFAIAAVVSSFSVGNIVQVYAASDAANIIFGVNEFAFGIAFAVVTSFVIFGGFERISRVTSVVLPVMSAVYLLLCVVVVAENSRFLHTFFCDILSQAFESDSACGGVLGFVFSKGFSEGVCKGTFSHESGSGTAPMAHANAQTDTPARQGLLGLFEVFADTIIMCTLSAFVILAAWRNGVENENGMGLVLDAFAAEMGDGICLVIGACILLFAFSTLICWAYYGKCCLEYITRSQTAKIVYILIYLAFVAFGTLLSQETVWLFADIAIALMSALNLPVMFIMRKEIKRETEVIFSTCQEPCRSKRRC